MPVPGVRRDAGDSRRSRAGRLGLCWRSSAPALVGWSSRDVLTDRGLGPACWASLASSRHGDGGRLGYRGWRCSRRPPFLLSTRPGCQSHRIGCAAWMRTTPCSTSSLSRGWTCSGTCPVTPLSPSRRAPDLLESRRAVAARPMPTSRSRPIRNHRVRLPPRAGLLQDHQRRCRPGSYRGGIIRRS